jgi:arginine utilization protein RocB
VSNQLPSTATAIFQESAEQLASRLEQEASDAAREMAIEARALAARFAEWQKERPPDKVRVATIQQLFELNRRAMDYISS